MSSKITSQKDMENIKQPLENLKNKPTEPVVKHGGKRANSGRAKGSKNDTTISREVALREFRASVAKVADQLFFTQLNLAKGERFLYHVKWIGKGAKRRKDVAVVTDRAIIKSYLLDEFQDDDDNYYYISTKPANNQALDSLLNRTFGTAQQSVDLTSDGERLGVGLDAEQAKQLLRARADRSDI